MRKFVFALAVVFIALATASAEETDGINDYDYCVDGCQGDYFACVEAQQTGCFTEFNQCTKNCEEDYPWHCEIDPESPSCGGAPPV